MASDLRSRFELILVLVLAFAGGQAVAGLFTESLSLVPDTLSVALTILAAGLVSRPPMGSHTFGWARVERLSQFIDGFVTIQIALVVVVLACVRLTAPDDVDEALVLAFASVGVLLYSFGMRCVPSDASALFAVELRERLAGGRVDFVIVAVSAIVIAATGWNRVDAVAAIIVSAHVVVDAKKDLRNSWHVLMEAAPMGVDVNGIGMDLASMPNVREVSDLHVWEISAGFPSLSAHLLIRGENSHSETLKQCRQLLEERHGIEHVTLQLEREDSTHDLISIDVIPPRAGS